MEVDPDFSSESSGSDEEESEDDFEIEIFIDDYENQNSDEEVAQPRFGGYDYEFVNEVSDNHKCPVCLLPMKDAVQTTECGHRFCKDCLHGILRNNRPAQCPIDRQEIKKKRGFYPDKAWDRDILGLHVKCKQNAIGCDWTGVLRHAEEHRDECPYEDEECIACGVNIQRRLLKNHHDDECPKRIIECEHCQDEFMFVQKQDHEGIYCRRFPLVCDNNCGKEGIPREEMESHISEKCPMTEVVCPYAEAGCLFQDKRCYLNDHMEASIDDHLELTWFSLAATKRELKGMKEANQKLTKSVADCHKQIENLASAVKSLQDSNVQQQRQAVIMEKKMSREKESVDNTLNKLKASISSLRQEVTRNTTPRLHDCGKDRVRVIGEMGGLPGWGDNGGDCLVGQRVTPVLGSKGKKENFLGNRVERITIPSWGVAEDDSREGNARLHDCGKDRVRVIGEMGGLKGWGDNGGDCLVGQRVTPVLGSKGKKESFLGNRVERMTIPSWGVAKDDSREGNACGQQIHRVL